MTDLSKLMQNAAILEVIDKSADEASSLSAQNSYQAQRIEELERESDKLRSLWDAEFRRAEKAEAENATLRQNNEYLQAKLNEAHTLMSQAMKPTKLRMISAQTGQTIQDAAIDAARSNRD
jgi:hypothetical protein